MNCELCNSDPCLCIERARDLIKRREELMALTNKQLAKEQSTTARQISKSRRRGFILVDGRKVKYTAPQPVKKRKVKNV